MSVHHPVRAAIALAGLFLACNPVSYADTLVIDAIQQAAGVERPVRGDTMSSVEARFGAPKRKEPAVGHPPIARWVYDGFTVYFEGNIVLQSVVHR